MAEEVMEVMIQDNVPICPRCQGALRRLYTNDILYVCTDKKCKTVLKVIDFGQSMREAKCKIL